MCSTRLRPALAGIAGLHPVCGHVGTRRKTCTNTKLSCLTHLRRLFSALSAVSFEIPDVHRSDGLGSEYAVDTPQVTRSPTCELLDALQALVLRLIGGVDGGRAGQRRRVQFQSKRPTGKAVERAATTPVSCLTRSRRSCSALSAASMVAEPGSDAESCP